VLTNLAGAPAARLAVGVVNAHMARAPGLRRHTHRVAEGAPPVPPERYGTYASAEGGRVELRPGDGGGLVVQVGGERLDARPLDARTYIVPLDGEERSLELLDLEVGPAVFFGLRVLSLVVPRPVGAKA
jgi:hypothetical protein